MTPGQRAVLERVMARQQSQQMQSAPTQGLTPQQQAILDRVQARANQPAEQPQSPDAAAAQSVNDRFADSQFFGTAQGNPKVAQALEDTASSATRTIRAGAEAVDQVGLGEAITGNERNPNDIPNLLNDGATFDLSPADQAKLAARLSVANDQERQRQAVWNTLPGARITQDENGFDMVEYKGQKAYINGPGLSQQDVAKGITDALMLAPTGKAYAALRGLPGVGKVMGAMGIGAGSGAALSAGQDVASNAAGDNPDANAGLFDVDAGRAGMYAAGGAVGDAAVMGANRIARQISRGSERTGRAAAQKMGVNYDELKPPLQSEVNKLGNQVSNPEDFARSVRSRNLPAEVPLTRPRALGLNHPEGQNLAQVEAVMARSGNPELLAQRSEATESLFENVNAIKTGDPTNPGMSVADAGQRVSSRLESMRRSEKQRLDDSWNAARTAISEARRNGTEPLAERADAVNIVRDIRTKLRDSEFTPGNYPEVFRQINGLVPPSQPGAKVKGIKLTKFNETIRALNDMAKGQASSQGKAAGDASKMLQSHLDNLVFQGLLSGDDDIIRQFKDSRTLAKQYHDRWNDADIIKKLTQPKQGSRTETLAVEPEAAMNVIFGAKGARLQSDPALRRDLETLRGRLGKDSQEWNALQQAAVDRIVNPFVTNSQYGGRDLSGVRMNQLWQNMKRDNASVVNTLFTPQQRRVMDEFAEVADWATREGKGIAHSTNNITAATSLLGNTAYRMGTAGLGPQFLKWAGVVPFAASTMDRIARNVQMGQVLSGPQAKRIGADPAARAIGGGAAGAAAGYDRQGE